MPGLGAYRPRRARQTETEDDHRIKILYRSQLSSQTFDALESSAQEA